MTRVGHASVLIQEGRLSRREQSNATTVSSTQPGEVGYPLLVSTGLLIAPTSALALPFVGVITSHLRKPRADGGLKDRGFL